MIDTSPGCRGLRAPQRTRTTSPCATAVRGSGPKVTTPHGLCRFDRLPIGARFEFRGRRYEKLALSLARDEERNGNVFLNETEVLPG